MKAVGVKVLKAKLSEYLRLVKSGETVLVTERDEVIAELRPARRQSRPPATLEESLATLAESGEVTLASEEIANWSGLSTKAAVTDISSVEILEDLRKDRR